MNETGFSQAKSRSIFSNISWVFELTHQEVIEMRYSADSEFSHILSISFEIHLGLLEFLLLSTLIPYISQVKYRSNAKKSKDFFGLFFFFKYYLMTLHLEHLITYSPEKEENGTEINLMK